MDFRLWRGPKEAEPPIDDTSKEKLGSAVQAMVDAKLGVLRATLLGRAGYLRAQAELCDSAALKSELGFRAAEIDYILSEMGKG